MANEEHLAILDQGVEVWNKWREDNPDVIPDLDGATLYVANLAGINLADASLAGAGLVRANLNFADLARSNLTKADLDGAFLVGAYLCGANLTGANLFEANLYRATLFTAELTDAILFKADITSANLGNANLSRANVTSLVYDRKAMLGCYLGIRGIDNCYGNPVFKRDAQDQDFIDALLHKTRKGWRKKLFQLWAWIDYGRSMPRVGGAALVLVLIFGTLYKIFPALISYGQHIKTPFTPYYFSFVTYTTLGFGDVTPRCLAGEILVSLEVVLGYVTLGLLLAILANTVARRS